MLCAVNAIALSLLVLSSACLPVSLLCAAACSWVRVTLNCCPCLYNVNLHAVAVYFAEATCIVGLGLWPGLTTARTSEMPDDFSEETELDFFTYFYKVRQAPALRLIPCGPLRRCRSSRVAPLVCYSYEVLAE